MVRANPNSNHLVRSERRDARRGEGQRELERRGQVGVVTSEC